MIKIGKGGDVFDAWLAASPPGSPPASPRCEKSEEITKQAGPPLKALFHQEAHLLNASPFTELVPRVASSSYTSFFKRRVYEERRKVRLRVCEVNKKARGAAREKRLENVSRFLGGSCCLDLFQQGRFKEAYRVACWEDINWKMICALCYGIKEMKSRVVQIKSGRSNLQIMEVMYELFLQTGLAKSLEQRTVFRVPSRTLTANLGIRKEIGAAIARGDAQRVKTLALSIHWRIGIRNFDKLFQKFLFYDHFLKRTNPALCWKLPTEA